MSVRRTPRSAMGRTNQLDGARRDTASHDPHTDPPNKSARLELDMGKALPPVYNGSRQQNPGSQTFRASARHDQPKPSPSISGSRPGWLTDRRGDERLGTADNVRVERTVDEVRRLFRQKLSTSKASIQEIFREADVHGEGCLGPVEFSEAMKRLGMVHNDQAVDRYTNSGRMDLQEFNQWFDDSFGQMILATPPGGHLDHLKVKGDQRNAKHLYIPTPQGRGMVGRLNEVLEVERIAEGSLPPRLDSNFSSVQYDILSFSLRPKHIDERLRIPVKKRVHLFDNPPPSGRRVAYHHGDTPYDIVTVRTPRSKEAVSFSSRIEAPVRLCTFSRIHQGGLPTRIAQELGATQGVVL